MQAGSQVRGPQTTERSVAAPTKMARNREDGMDFTDRLHVLADLIASTKNMSQTREATKPI